LKEKGKEGFPNPNPRPETPTCTNYRSMTDQALEEGELLCRNGIYPFSAACLAKVTTQNEVHRFNNPVAQEVQSQWVHPQKHISGFSGSVNPQQICLQQNNTLVYPQTANGSAMVQQHVSPFGLVPNFEGGQAMSYTLSPGASVIVGQGGQPIFSQMSYPFPNNQVNYGHVGVFNSPVYQQPLQVFQLPLYQQYMHQTPLCQQPLQGHFLSTVVTEPVFC